MDKPIELSTQRLLLRQFTKEDVDDVLHYMGNPGWARYQVNIPLVPLSRENAESLVAMFSDLAKWAGIGMLRMFAIVLDGKVIGEIALNQRDNDRQNERAEIGILFHANTGAKD